MYRQIIPPGFSHTSNIYKIKNKYFILIPKNASNTILYGHKNISKALSIYKSEIPDKINVFVREPIERFTSGLKESIKRSTIYVEEGKIADPSSVPLSEDIKSVYKDLIFKIKDNPIEFINTVINLLEQSYFDPHLCPQWYFYTSINRKVISNICLYDINNINNIMESMSLEVKKSFNINSSFDTEDFMNNNFKIIDLMDKRKISYIKKITKKTISRLDRKINRLYNSIKIIPHSTIEKQSKVFKFINYNDWLEASIIIKNIINENLQMQEKIRNLYSIDNDLYLKAKGLSGYILNNKVIL